MPARGGDGKPERTVPRRAARVGVVLLLVVLLVVGLLSGGWVITSKSGCEDRGSTDPDYANANWYGLGVGVCVAE